MDSPTPETQSQEKLAKQLSEPMTLDYGGRNTTISPEGTYDVTFYADVDRMVNHAVVAEALRINESGIAGAEFDLIDASDSRVGEWAMKALSHYWENDLHTAQLSYRHGYLGCEILYAEEGDTLAQIGLKPFHPADATPLKTTHQEYAGIRVKNLKDKGQATLRAGGRWPNRAFWHCHDGTFTRFYGNSVLMPAHRPWQRLAERQGIEQNIDRATTRYAVPGPKCRYTERASITRGADGVLNYEANKEKWRRMLHDWDSGMAILLSSERDPNTKEYTEDVEWPETVLNVAPLLEVEKALESRICYGIGTPRELMESVETGGWAGRNVTMETFLSTQQRYGRQLLKSWYQQIALPLARFLFGPSVHFAIKMKKLNESRANAAAGQSPDDPNLQPVGNSPAPNPSGYSLPGRNPQQPGQRPAQPPRPSQARLLSAWDNVQRRLARGPILLQAEFRETDHPRESDGKFTDGVPGSKKAGEATSKSDPDNPYKGTKSEKRYKPKPEGWGEPIIPGVKPTGLWNIGTSGGYKRAKPLIDEVKRLYAADPEKITADDVRKLAEQILYTSGRDALYALAQATGVKTGTSKAIAERITAPLSKQQLELEEVDQTKELVLQRKVRQDGGTPAEAKEVTRYARQLRDEGNKSIDLRNQAVKYAYELISKELGQPFNAGHPAFDSGDYTAIPAYDTITAEVNSHYAGLFGEGGERYEGDVESKANDPQKLWEMLAEGIVPRLTINDTFTRALEEWERIKAAKPAATAEEVPF